MAGIERSNGQGNPPILRDSKNQKDMEDKLLDRIKKEEERYLTANKIETLAQGISIETAEIQARQDRLSEGAIELREPVDHKVVLRDPKDPKTLQAKDDVVQTTNTVSTKVLSQLPQTTLESLKGKVKLGSS